MTATIGLAAAMPARGQDPGIGYIQSCHAMVTGHQYRAALSTCGYGVALYHQTQISAGSKVFWDVIYFEADGLAYSAIALGGLDRHVDAVTYAESSYRLLAYCNATFALKPDQRAKVIRLAEEVRQLAASEQAAAAGAHPTAKPSHAT